MEYTDGSTWKRILIDTNEKISRTNGSKNESYFVAVVRELGKISYFLKNILISRANRT